MSTTHADLIDRLTNLEAHKRAIQSARETLLAHTQERLAGVVAVLPQVEEARDADEDDGGILSHRMHRTLLDERERLERVLAR